MMRAIAMIAAAACAAAPVAARAEAIPSKARKLAEHGRAMHEKGDYSRAIVAFKEAYVIAPSSGLLFNIAQAYRLEGNCDDAAQMYRRFLATNPSPDARTLADSHLRTVERCMQKRSLNIPLDESMAYLQVPPPPGPERLLVDEPESSPSSSGSLKKNIGIGVVIGGSIALSAAMFYGLRAHSASQEVERAYAEGAKWKDIAELHDRGERSSRNAMFLGIGGGLAVAGGVTLYLLGKRAERSVPVVPVAIVPRASGAEVSVAWRF